jgi:hypothetical protein
MSEEIKKLTEEELQQIKEMQVQYNQFIFELGSAEIQLQNITSTKEAIEVEKNNILEDIKKLGDRERELVKVLQEKYGNGNIDIETGVVNPS